MIISVLFSLACLMGAAGVVLLAANAHTAPGAGLDSAGAMLLFHAPAAMAVLLAGSVLIWRPLALIGAGGLILGASLFAGDLALRAFTGHKLFPMAAPAGGTILIVFWVLLAVAAMLAARQS